jgi:hypothetical protein
MKAAVRGALKMHILTKSLSCAANPSPSRYPGKKLPLSVIPARRRRKRAVWGSSHNLYYLAAARQDAVAGTPIYSPLMMAVAFSFTTCRRW